MLRRNYSDLVILSIAGYGGEDMSFSADTGMAECLVVGRKTKTATKRATFVVLKERPAYPLLGASAAKQIHRLIAEKNLRCLEDDPPCSARRALGCAVVCVRTIADNCCC